MFVNVFWLFCGTMMALQVDVQLPWTYLNHTVVLKGHTVNLVYYNSKIHLEYLTNHGKCLLYVAIITVSRLFTV